MSNARRSSAELPPESNVVMTWTALVCRESSPPPEPTPCRR
ncbi:MAG: hypothetical protein ACLRWP_01015 [Bilophila wadsworthia]